MKCGSAYQMKARVLETTNHLIPDGLGGGKLIVPPKAARIREDLKDGAESL